MKYFRTYCATLVVLLLLTSFSSASSGGALQPNSVGYTHWKSLAAKDKLVVVAAVIDAATFEWVEGYSEAELDVEQLLQRSRQASANAYVNRVHQLPFPRPPRFSKSLEKYREAIDQIYSRHAARRTPLTEVIWCLADVRPASCPRTSSHR